MIAKILFYTFLVIFIILVCIVLVMLTLKFINNKRFMEKFKYSSSNKSKDKSIAIIGSGPSGIMTAKHLKEKGYTNITIYGDFDKCQLKTLHINDIPIDTQACFLHQGYNNTVAVLCKDYGFNIESIYTNFIDKNVKNIRPTKWQSFKLGLLIIYYYYINQKSDVLGESAQQFLDNNSINAWFDQNLALNGQLYGYTEEISTLDAMTWYETFIPTLFLPFLTLHLNGTSIIKEGYEPLFKKILNSLNINRIKKDVYSVIPEDDGKIKLILKDKTEVYYNNVILACPTTNVYSPLDNVLKYSDYSVTYIFVLFYYSKVIPNKIGVYYNSEALNNSAYNTITAHRYFGDNEDGLSINGVLGYIDPIIDKDRLLSNIIKQTSEILKIPHMETIYWRTEAYNTRFSSDTIKKGLYSKAWDLQGKDGIFYASAPFCHWNIDSICDHVKRMCTKI